MKFGGTSVADADAMTRVVSIVRRQWESQPKDSRPPVVVVSALSKVTDGLIRALDLARNGHDAKAVSALLVDVMNRHIEIARTLTSGQRADELVSTLQVEFANMI